MDHDHGPVAVAIRVGVVVRVIAETGLHQVRDRERYTLRLLIDALQSNDSDSILIRRRLALRTVAPNKSDGRVGNGLTRVVDDGDCHGRVPSSPVTCPRFSIQIRDIYLLLKCMYLTDEGRPISSHYSCLPGLYAQIYIQLGR